MDYDEQVTIQLPGGDIIALRQNNLIRARSVKYAHAKRFEPPRLVEKWDGLMDCTRPGPVCPQRPSRLNFVTGDLVREQPMDEDCLNLTITAPVHVLDGNGAKEKKLPVMVWFHGGAFLTGGGDFDCYQPMSLASRNIVIVNVTHRVGIFGYLPIEGVAPANLGLLDQIEALRWVQNNISHFGGDPSQVTVVGQSAGAQSIFCLMVSDHTDGLFHRAILQSTPLGKLLPPDQEKIDRELSQIAKELFHQNPYTASTEEVLVVQMQMLAAGKRLGLTGTGYGHRFGSHPLPDASELNKKIDQAAQKYSIMIGWTKQESTALVLLMMDHLSYFFKLPIIGRYIQSLVAWWHSRSLFIWPSQNFHNKFLRAGGESVTFCFRWSPLRSPFGATHCIELPFLFGSWLTWKTAPMVDSPDAQDVIERVGSEVKDLWAAFVKGEHLARKHFEIDERFLFRS